jgi:hypothetical protein
MTFPIDIQQLRTLTEERYMRFPEESQEAPKDFKPFDDLLPWLTEKEKSFIVHDGKLYLNWRKLKLVDVFDAMLDAIQYGPEDEDVPVIHCVSGIFRMEGPTLQSLGGSTNHENWASSCLFSAFDNIVGYSTECGTFLLGFTLQDLKQSYTVYNKDIEELPSFDDEMRALMKDKYEVAIKHILGLEPQPIDD